MLSKQSATTLIAKATLKQLTNLKPAMVGPARQKPQLAKKVDT